MAAKVQLGLFMVAAMGCFMMEPVSAFSHIVGGSSGWTYPPNATFYQEWAAKPRVFGVNDSLVFPYKSGVYNIIQVNKKDFEGCTMDEYIQMYAHGPTVVTLEKLGDYYFYDGVGKHCEAGQKLAVSVTSKTEGGSGKHFRFGVDNELAAAPAPAPSATTAGHLKSSASSVSSCIGLGSGLLAFLVSLFI